MTIAEKLSRAKDDIDAVYEAGYGKGYAEGEANGTGGYDQGYADGKQAQYDEFWDRFQDNGNRTNYRQSFSGWRDEYIRPKYKVVPTVARSLSTTFEECPNVKKFEAKYFDFSQVPYGTAQNQGAYYTFASCAALEEIEDVGLSPTFMYTGTFAWDANLHTIAKITVDENTQFASAFTQTRGLVNLTFEGTIGQNGLNFQHSTKLSKASISSIINHLSDTTSGLSITLSKTAVNNAFNTVPDIMSPAWNELIQRKPNWTINLL